MRITAVEIRRNERDGQHSLALDRATRDALATWCRLRWPTGTAKAAAKEFDLTVDEARGLVAGRASSVTIDRVWKAPKGGWRVLLPVLGAVIGHGLEEHLERERDAYEAHAERLAALASHLRFGRAARDLRPPGLAVAPPDRRIADRRRMGKAEV